MTDQASRESSNDPSADDTPTGDSLRVGRGLVEGDGSSRTITDDGALEHEFVEEQHGHPDDRVERERAGLEPRESLAEGGLGIHVMDSDGIDTHDE
jgi:hypothetical protein